MHLQLQWNIIDASRQATLSWAVEPGFVGSSVRPLNHYLRQKLTTARYASGASDFIAGSRAG